MIVEIYEAIDAGERALMSLKEAQQYLNSAGTWGLFDMFGGNLITGLMKHSKINNASRAIEDARYDLRKFQKELKDVDTLVPDVNIGDDVFIWDNEIITLEEIARKCGTINYEILCTISDRVPRKFVY